MLWVMTQIFIPFVNKLHAYLLTALLSHDNVKVENFKYLVDLISVTRTHSTSLTGEKAKSNGQIIERIFDLVHLSWR